MIKNEKGRSERKKIDSLRTNFVRYIHCGHERALYVGLCKFRKKSQARLEKKSCSKGGARGLRNKSLQEDKCFLAFSSIYFMAKLSQTRKRGQIYAETELLFVVDGSPYVVQTEATSSWKVVNENF